MKVRALIKEVKETVYVVLENDGDGVNLKAVDSEGEDLENGLLLKISASKGVQFYEEVNPDLGLPLSNCLAGHTYLKRGKNL